jgi:hypothetical protein
LKYHCLGAARMKITVAGVAPILVCVIVDVEKGRKLESSEAVKCRTSRGRNCSSLKSSFCSVGPWTSNSSSRAIAIPFHSARISHGDAPPSGREKVRIRIRKSNPGRAAPHRPEVVGKSPSVAPLPSARHSRAILMPFSCHFHAVLVYARGWESAL